MDLAAAVMADDAFMNQTTPNNRQPTTTDDYIASRDDVTTESDDVIGNAMDDGPSSAPTAYEDALAAAVKSPTWSAILIIIACTVIMVGTVLGNLLVCTAVSIVRKLRTPSNWLIVSLAVADLCVALMVMPLATMYEAMGFWSLGHTVCDMWTSLDVMLCTASILNLCMISVDRYLVITRPFQYAMKRTPLRMALMIFCVWLLSALISIPPLFGWKEDPVDGQCQLSQAIGYQFYATIGAFYLPLAVMIFIYYRIYAVSARILKAEAKTKLPGDAIGRRPSYLPPSSRKCSMDIGGAGHLAAGHNNRLDVNDFRSSIVGGGGESYTTHSRSSSIDISPRTPLKKNFSFLQRSGSHRMSAASRERKTTKTLGVIMGAFVACWLPFFILALVRPFLHDKSAIPPWLESLLLWLGYANSFFNPIIYARFNREFRTPFKEILFGRCRGINVRLRSESYTEQYGPASSAAHDSWRSGHEWSRATSTTTATTTGAVRPSSLCGLPEDRAVATAAVDGSSARPSVFITLSDEPTSPLNHQEQNHEESKL